MQQAVLIKEIDSQIHSMLEYDEKMDHISQNLSEASNSKALPQDQRQNSR